MKARRAGSLCSKFTGSFGRQTRAATLSAPAIKIRVAIGSLDILADFGRFLCSLTGLASTGMVLWSPCHKFY